MKKGSVVQRTRDLRSRCCVWIGIAETFQEIMDTPHHSEVNLIDGSQKEIRDLFSHLPWPFCSVQKSVRAYARVVGARRSFAWPGPNRN